MKGYRIATHLDYAYILRLLIDGDSNGVLVRRLNVVHESPFSLLEISRAPYMLTVNGLSGFSPEGEECIIRIADNSVHNVEMKRGDGEWMAPEMSSVILLIPE